MSFPEHRLDSLAEDARKAETSPPRREESQHTVGREKFVRDLYGSENLFGHWNALRFDHRFIRENIDQTQGREEIIHAIVDGHPNHEQIHNLFEEASDQGKVADYRRGEANDHYEEILRSIESQMGESALHLASMMMQQMDEKEVADMRKLVLFAARLLWEHRFETLHAQTSEHHLCDDLDLIRKIVISLRKTNGDFSIGKRFFEKARELYGTWWTSHQHRDQLHQTHAYRLMEDLRKFVTE